MAGEGYETSVYQPPRSRRPTNISTTLNRGLLDKGDMAAWLSSLPKPVGLMAPNDVRAQTGAQCLCAVRDRRARRSGRHWRGQ